MCIVLVCLWTVYKHARVTWHAIARGSEDALVQHGDALAQHAHLDGYIHTAGSGIAPIPNIWRLDPHNAHQGQPTVSVIPILYRHPP